VARQRAVRPQTLDPSTPIPDKLYFKIGEVAKLVGVQAHVLRYWQGEIPAIRPSKSASNQRRYRYKDVEIFREIRRLLYDERYTLAGARRRILSREAPTAEDATGGGTRAAPVSDAGERPAGNTAIAADSAWPSADSQGSLVSLSQRSQGSAGSRLELEADSIVLDGELVQRLRRGLKDLVRLTGEEP
jgi:DNA-binding transcriptional MerR regulator